jgi:hypothetical protein
MKSYILIATTLFLLLSAALCLAADSPAKPASGSGKKKLLLFAKNPADWSIVRNGASGTLRYRPAGGAFTLSAAGLRPQAAYALIRYADAPPHAEILARGASNGRGQLELSGSWQNWTKKFWLVAGEDLEGRAGSAGRLIAWRPERYLFEEKQLGISCNCPEPEEP